MFTRQGMWPTVQYYLVSPARHATSNELTVWPIIDLSAIAHNFGKTSNIVGHMSLQTTCPILYLLSKSEMQHRFLNFSGILVMFMNSQTDQFSHLSSSYKHFWECLFSLKLHKFPLIVLTLCEIIDQFSYVLSHFFYF